MTSGRGSVAIASPPDRPNDAFSNNLLAKDADREVVEKQRTTSMPLLSLLRPISRRRKPGKTRPAGRLGYGVTTVTSYPRFDSSCASE